MLHPKNWISCLQTHASLVSVVNAEQSVQHLLEQEDESFLTRDVDVEDFTPPEGTSKPGENWIEVDNLKSLITWTLDTSYSSWGVNDLRPRINSITCWWDELTTTADGEDNDTLRRTFTWNRKLGAPIKNDSTDFDVDGALAGLAGRADSLSFPLNVRAIFYDGVTFSEREYLTISPMGLDLNLEDKTAVVRF